MEKHLDPIELNDAELAAVAGGLLNNSLNQFANNSGGVGNATASGTNSSAAYLAGNVVPVQIIG